MKIVRFPMDYLIERPRDVPYRTLFEWFASERNTQLAKKNYIVSHRYYLTDPIQFQNIWKIALADKTKWVVYTFTDPDTNIHYHQWIPLGEDE